MSILLITECAEEFEKMRNEFYDEIQPKGVVERGYVDDIVALTWETRRCQRAKAGIINATLLEALTGMLKQQLTYRDFGGNVLACRIAAEDLARGWFTDEEAKTEVATQLRKFGLDEGAIEAESFRLRAEDLERCNRMQADAESRREKALRFVEKLRKKFGARLRQSSDRILETEEVPPLIPIVERQD